MYTKILNLSKLAAMVLVSFSTAFSQTVEDSENIEVGATLVESDVYIDVSNNNVQFGQLVVPDSERSIFGIAGPKVSWKAPNGSEWSIQITTNDTGSTTGLTNSNGDSLQLKFNNSNLGSPESVTSPKEDEFTGTAPIYRTILNSSASAEDKIALAFAGSSDLPASETDYDLNFAVGVPSTARGGNYGATIVLELVVLPEGN